LVHLTSCSALTSDNLPVLIDTRILLILSALTGTPCVQTHRLGQRPGPFLSNRNCITIWLSIIVLRTSPTPFSML
jgi:hypothetical protein